MKSRFIPLIVVVLLVASCGTIATPEWSAEAQGTRAAQAETSAFQTSSAPTATYIPPTATRVPPTATLTATPIPPTVTPAPPTEAAAQPTIGQSTMATPTQAAAALTGDPANGQVLFNELQPEAGFACATCHRIDSEERLVGPGLLNISERATTRPTGGDAVTYLRISIVDPSAYVVPDFPDMLMPRVYSQIFTEQEINDLVAYLLTL